MQQIREKMRQARNAAGLSLAQLGAATGYDRTSLSGVETGRRAVTIKALTEYVAAYDRALKTGGLLTDYWVALLKGDAMLRRSVVFALGTLAPVGMAVRPYVAEALRGSILAALGGDDWQAIAEEHGRLFMSEAPAAFSTRLTGDLLNLKGAIESGPSLAARRAAAKMLALHAMGTANIGDSVGARRWYRAARCAADVSDDDHLRAWVRAREAFRGGYEGLSPHEVLAIARGVEGQVEAALATAQAYARLGESERALRALTGARRLYDGGQHDEASIYSMQPWRMVISTAYVFALLGRPDDCARELADSVPPQLRRWRAQYRLQLAVALTRSGDSLAGGQAAREAWQELAREQRSIVVARMMSEATGRELVSS
jgi:transcriptional regulator with XRE-family HTH domain